jgi:hypothetical protein
VGWPLAARAQHAVPVDRVPRPDIASHRATTIKLGPTRFHPR